MKIIDGIGFFGPHIMLMITVVILWKQSKYFYGYLLFFIINTSINKLLKQLVREPRPKDGKNIMDFEKTTYDGVEEYGMPSGHAQSCFYSLTYLYLVKESPTWLLLELFIASASFYQRWSYHRHTAKQLLIGSVVGIFIGWVSVTFINKYLTTQ
jgi:membrane-associated phospholipid phosphatase